jgi:glycosyltransferase involved in cell wall biosynthesis
VLVSIITVVFNGEKYLKKTIDSVLNQTYQNIEYIIIDGESTDSTIDIIKSYANKIAYWVSEPDNGIYDAMNKGISIARGELICILNSDDWFEPSAVELFVNSYRETDSKYVIIVGDTNRIGKNDKVLFTMKNSEEIFRRKINYTMSVSHPSVCISASVYKELLKGFRLKYKIISDYDLIFRASKSPQINFIFLHNTVVNMREGGVSDSFKPRTIFQRSYERFLIRKNFQNTAVNFSYCSKFFIEDFLRQFLKKYYPNSFLLKNKR